MDWGEMINNAFAEVKSLFVKGFQPLVLFQKKHIDSCTLDLYDEINVLELQNRLCAFIQFPSNFIVVCVPKRKISTHILSRMSKVYRCQIKTKKEEKSPLWDRQVLKSDRQISSTWIQTAIIKKIRQRFSLPFSIQNEKGCFGCS